MQSSSGVTADKQGRPYAKLSELKPGDHVEVDGDFTCMSGIKEVKEEGNDLYVECSSGTHLLYGQLAPDGDTLIGIYKVMP